MHFHTALRLCSLVANVMSPYGYSSIHGSGEDEAEEPWRGGNTAVMITHRWDL